MKSRRSLTRSQLALRLVAAAATAAVIPAVVVAGGTGPATAAPHKDSTHGPALDTSGDLPAGYVAMQKAADQARLRDAKDRAGTLSTDTLAASTTTSKAHGPAARPGPAPTTSTAPATSSPADPGSVLVLYDTTGPWGYLGDLYRMSIANLVGHFGKGVASKPVQDYRAGDVNAYAATFYVGSTFYGDSTGIPDQIPAAFFSDVVTTSRPVVWLYDNIWEFGDHPTDRDAFVQKYGWDPSNTFGFGLVANQVSYRGQVLTRNTLNGGVYQPYVIDTTKAHVLATATDTTTGTSAPWLVRSGNVYYIGDNPFSYINETDRYLAFADLLYDVLAPATAERHRALVRLEDVSAADDPADLERAADYLASQGIPFGINVIPVYKDPNGYYNDGKPVTITLSHAKAFISSIKYALSKGGVLMEHGYTHQYGNVANPYSGVTADDFEFFLSHIGVDSNTGLDNSVILDGPVRNDSSKWAQDRITKGLAEFAKAGLPRPTLWTTPHYAASAVDYQTIGNNFSARWERSLYYEGTLDGHPDNSSWIGQFFPYDVRDIYGTTVIPENLGNYEPEPENNHPARLPADLVASAQANLVVRDGFASFFYHPYYGLEPLQQIVDGVRNLGYTFVSPTSVAQ